MCSKACSQVILISANVILFLLGIATTVLGSLALGFANDYLTSQGLQLDEQFIVWGVVCGGVLILMGFVGILAAIPGDGCITFQKFLLGIYVTVVSILVALQVIGGVLALVYSDEIQETPMASADGSKQPYATKVQLAMESFISSLFNRCCVSQVTGPDTTCNSIRWFLDMKGVWTASGQYNGCGATAEQFHTKFLAWFADNFGRIAIAMIAMGAVELLLVVSSCHLLCSMTLEQMANGGAFVVQSKGKGLDDAAGPGVEMGPTDAVPV